MMKAGSSEAIAAWSDDVDSLLSEIEALRNRRRIEITQERTLESARRMIRSRRETALEELASLANS